MKIDEVRTDYKKRCFVIRTAKGEYPFPFAKFPHPPSVSDRVKEVFPDRETGNEAFTYRLDSGIEDTAHMEAVLEYNRDPQYMHKILLYRLSVEALEAAEKSDLSKRELIRRLGTSPSQLYRLLDPTYYGKSLSQMIALLHLLGKEVDLVVREKTHRLPGVPAGSKSMA